MRKEIEKCDIFMGTILLHSLAGGTGSGVGSRFIERYREEFPCSYLLTSSIWPKASKSIRNSESQNHYRWRNTSSILQHHFRIVIFAKVCGWYDYF
jgi:hypothetical protein